MEFQSTHHPLRTLSILFIIWKLVILCIAILSPGTGYDASTLQLFTITQQSSSSSSSIPFNPAFVTDPLTHIALKLSRWDAIYFLSIADRGYLWEQEWAFSWAWSKLMRLCSAPFTSAAGSSLVADALAGIFLAHLAHYASVVLLYHLTLRLTGLSNSIRRRLAFVAASLHIIAPAGIFLSAPCAEALTSALSFAGILLYTYSSPWATIVSGVIFGLAALIRSNVLLNGILFLSDVLLRHLPDLYSTYRAGKNLNTTTLINLCASITAGIALAIGFITPQAIAWVSFCYPFPATEREAWCHAIPPSIYTHVQSKYWNVGFLRYWTLPNVPLFAMAAPMIGILVWSALDTLRPALSAIRFTSSSASSPASSSASSPASSPASPTTSKTTSPQKPHPKPDVAPITKYLLATIATPQLLLALLATTSFHVQIITRLASSCPLLCIWLARKIIAGPSASASSSASSARTRLTGKEKTRSHAVENKDELQTDTLVKIPWRADRVRFSHMAVRYMVVYALVQAGLFASFLPPA